MDSPPQQGWQALDDDGRDFLAQALGQIDGALGPINGAAGAAGAAGAVGDIPGRAADRQPDRSSPEGTGRLAALLQAAVAAGASDLHLCAGMAPHLRIHGALRPLSTTGGLDAGVIDAEAMQHLLEEVLTPEQRRELAAEGDLDTGMWMENARLLTGAGAAHSTGDGRRFRASLFRHSGALAAAIRIVPDTVPSLGELGLPTTLSRLAAIDSGLVLVTGPTGSGKSSTLAAMVDEINRSRVAHVITIEDPIEYRYRPVRSIIQQREIGADTTSFSAALRRALRQDPDVILIGELRDLETIRIALTAAETGHLVLATLHSADATSAVNRIVDVFPASQQAQIRSQLALSVRGSVSQRLVPAVGGGVVPITEVMVTTSAVRNLIREEKVHQLLTTLETGADVGMHSFAQSISSLVKAGRLDPAAAGAAIEQVGTRPTVGR